MRKGNEGQQPGDGYRKNFNKSPRGKFGIGKKRAANSRSKSRG